MGTRNLTCVYIDGEYKIAQYGQWDGYPEGQGVTCLKFLRNTMQDELFKRKLRELRYLSDDEAEAAVNQCKEMGTVWQKKYPQFTRDTGAEILECVQNGNCDYGVTNSLTFAADSLMCEWAYVIDFDKRTFEVYQGFNHEPLTQSDRFYFLSEKEPTYAGLEKQYHGIKLAKEFSLDDLPTEEEFIEAFKDNDEE